MIHILLYIVAALALWGGGSVLVNAPAVTQQMAGLLILLISVVALGFAEVIRHTRNAAKQIAAAVRAPARSAEDDAAPEGG